MNRSTVGRQIVTRVRGIVVAKFLDIPVEIAYL